MQLKQEKAPKSPSPKPGAKMTSGKSSPERKGGKKKKDKKKFARHKVRSDSPDKEFYETVGDPAETQVSHFVLLVQYLIPVVIVDNIDTF